MDRSTALLRPAHWALCAIASGWLVSIVCTPAQAKPQPELFPPVQTFRDLQLVTFACSRENTASSCDQARASANPLLDNSRLPTSCKDVLWAIQQQAKTAATNSLSRRDGLDRSAKDLTLLCKPKPMPPASTGGKVAAPGSAGNFGFGSPQPAR